MSMLGRGPRVNGTPDTSDDIGRERLWALAADIRGQVRDRLPPADIAGMVARWVEEEQAEETRIGALTMTAQLKDHSGLRPPVLHGLLRAGETLNIIAPPKTGKSWLTYGLALSVVTGKRWLDTFTPVPGRVLICDNELHQETLVDRIPRVAAKMGLGQSEWTDQLDTLTLRGRLKDIHRLASDEFAAMTPGTYKLIVIDALYRVLPPATSENDNAAMAGVYNTIDHLAARLQCAFVLIHHSTKGSQSGKAVTDVGAGAGSISRAADTHFILRQHQEQGVVVADGVTRSWAPLDPFCLRWQWPLWTRDDHLDPALLKPDKPPRKKPEKPQDEPAEQPWTAERFAAEFGTPEPRPKDALLEAASSHLSDRKANTLLKRAIATSKLHEWAKGKVATVPPPVDAQPDVTSTVLKRDAVIEAIEQNPDASDSDIAQDCGVSRNYVWRIQKELAA
jgi:hypothetical protein